MPLRVYSLFFYLTASWFVVPDFVQGGPSLDIKKNGNFASFERSSSKDTAQKLPASVDPAEVNKPLPPRDTSQKQQTPPAPVDRAELRRNRESFLGRFPAASVQPSQPALKPQPTPGPGSQPATRPGSQPATRPGPQPAPRLRPQPTPRLKPAPTSLPAPTPKPPQSSIPGNPAGQAAVKEGPCQLTGNNAEDAKALLAEGTRDEANDASGESTSTTLTQENGAHAKVTKGHEHQLAGQQSMARQDFRFAGIGIVGIIVIIVIVSVIVLGLSIGVCICSGHQAPIAQDPSESEVLVPSAEALEALRDVSQ